MSCRVVSDRGSVVLSCRYVLCRLLFRVIRVLRVLRFIPFASELMFRPSATSASGFCMLALRKRRKTHMTREQSRHERATNRHRHNHDVAQRGPTFRFHRNCEGALGILGCRTSVDTKSLALGLRSALGGRNEGVDMTSTLWAGRVRTGLYQTGSGPFRPGPRLVSLGVAPYPNNRLARLYQVRSVAALQH